MAKSDWTPPANEDYIPLPRLPFFPAWRRTISPGLFEFVLPPAIGSSPGTPPRRYLNALQPIDECEEILLLKQSQREIDTSHGKIRCHVNYVPANGQGEDRSSVNGLRWDQLQRLINETQGRGESFWRRWHEMSRVVDVPIENEGQNRALEDVTGSVEEEERETLCDKQEKVQQGVDTVPSPNDPAQARNMAFFSVFDGHAGAAIADILEKSAHALLGLSLAKDKDAANGDQEAIVQIMKDVFITIPQDISESSLSVIDSPLITSSNTTLPGLPSPAQLQLTGLELPGACFATVFLDLAAGKMYTAHGGDVRVVAVWQNKETGRYRIEQITEDLNGYNPYEVERIRADHPGEEGAMVPQFDGEFHRVLGALLPTSAVGDVHYNREETERQRLLAEELHHVYKVDHPTLSPPYIAWEPRVAVHPLQNANDEMLHTVVIGSDGLWDMLSNEEALLAVLSHESIPPGSTAIKADLRRDVPLATHDSNNDHGDQCLFQDANFSTHLIRNALAQGSQEQLRQMLSLKHGTRSFRDDITAMVIQLDNMNIDHTCK